MNHIRALPNLLPPARVRVEFRESYMPADPLNDAQAMERRIALGVSSPIAEIARVEGLTYDEARAKFDQNMADTRLLGDGPPALERVVEVSTVEDAA